MSDDFFSQLELELRDLTLKGAHLADTTYRVRHRAIVLLRRCAVIATLALALAASLDGEFPASASGRPPVPPALVAHGQ